MQNLSMWKNRRVPTAGRTQQGKKPHHGWLPGPNRLDDDQFAVIMPNNNEENKLEVQDNKTHKMAMLSDSTNTLLSSATNKISCWKKKDGATYEFLGGDNQDNDDENKVCCDTAIVSVV